MNELIALALRRAGVNTLAEFQALQGLPQTGEADPETQLALEPYLLGFRTIRIQPGDTYWELAARYGTTSQAIATANPSLDPERLPVGAPMRVPRGFPVVPTDVPMTSNLCSLCIRGLVGRYPGLCRMEALTTTAFGRPVEALTMGSGQRRVLYTAAHHANEWITATLLLAFAEDLAVIPEGNCWRWLPSIWSPWWTPTAWIWSPAPCRQTAETTPLPGAWLPITPAFPSPTAGKQISWGLT